ncbi:MAG TPA: hypothetical protein VD902_11480 [Symbiobacteriaceae bacterium]|nr:hypothetical protein [Symbiobacteriaceae bacterium]
MAKEVWTVYLDGKQHVVELEYGLLPGRRRVMVDGVTVIDRKGLFEPGSREPLHIGRHPGYIQIRSNGLTARYDLVMGGRSVTTGERVDEISHVPENTVLAAGLLAVVVAVLAYVKLPGGLSTWCAALLAAAGVAALLLRGRYMLLVLGALMLSVGVITAVAHPGALALGLALFGAPGAWVLLRYVQLRA